MGPVRSLVKHLKYQVFYNRAWRSSCVHTGRDDRSRSSGHSELCGPARRRLPLRVHTTSSAIGLSPSALTAHLNSSAMRHDSQEPRARTSPARPSRKVLSAADGPRPSACRHYDRDITTSLPLNTRYRNSHRPHRDPTPLQASSTRARTRSTSWPAIDFGSVSVRCPCRAGWAGEVR